MKNKLLPFLAVSLSILANAQSNFAGSGIALNFNGSTGNYIDLGDVYNNLNFPFTFEVWLKLPENPVNNYGIFASDNALSNYKGFWIVVNTSDQLVVECGDGNGDGYQNRVGKMTESTVPIKQWFHLAVVCKSALDISIYFNGLKQPLKNTNGTASVTNIIHSNADASIALQQNFNGANALYGRMDEIRLWNIVKDSATIRNKMCQKLKGTEEGLIGYWTIDESYTSDSVLDKSSSRVNGTIIGAVGRVISGAPIGDASVWVFTNNWDGERVSLGSAQSDRLTVKNISTQAQGVFVYRVDSNPYSAVGLNQFPSSYYGVFITDSDKVAQCTVVYHYTFNDSIINSGSQLNASLFYRPDGSAPSWTNSDAALDTSTKKLNLEKVKGRNEYILNVKNPNRKMTAQIENLNIAVYPNPFSNELKLQTTGTASSVSIMNVSGIVVYHSTPSSPAIEINTSSWADGLYLVAENDGNEIFYRKIIRSR